MAEQMPVVRKTIYTTVIKRMLDILLSGLAIAGLSPLFLILSVLELICHGSPILFAQERPGLHGKIFRLYKFRSMTDARDENGELLPGEQRLTTFGRFLRKYSLDELPELFCIFTGRMSIIGPRPLLVKYLPLYSERHRMRHAVKPGFACVPLKPIQTWSWQDQFENDLWYVEHCSFSVDVRMVFAVLREAIVGSKYRVNDTRSEFSGDNLNADAKNNPDQSQTDGFAQDRREG